MPRVPRSKRSLAAVFLLTVIVVIGATAAGPFLAQPPGTAPDTPEYDTASLVPDRVATDGSIEGATRTESGTVLIDLLHSNRVSKDALEPFTSAIQAAGWNVEYAESGDNFETALSRADALVVIDPGREYAPRQVDRVETFVENGGRVMMAGEPRQLAIRQAGLFAVVVQQENNLGPLATRFGITYGDSYLYNMESNDGNFKHIFGQARDGPELVTGVEEMAMYVATTVRTSEGTSLVEAEPGTTQDRTGASGEYSLAVQNGNVVAVGDKSFIQRGNYKAADNDQFLGNVVSFLTAADRRRTLLDYPAIVDRSPSVRYTSLGLLDAAQEVTADLKASRPGQPRVVLEQDRVAADETDVLITTFDYLNRNPGLGTGIEVADGDVSVPGYESDTEGVYVIHKPTSGYDLVVAADTAERAEEAVDRVTASGGLEEHAISDSTVVVRTDDAEVPEGDDEAGSGDGAADSGTGTETATAD